MNRIITNILASFIPSKSKRRSFRRRCKNQKPLSLNNRFVLIRESGEEILYPKIAGLDVIFNGKNSLVKIYEPCKFENTILQLGDDNVVEIKKTKYSITNFVMPYTMRKNSKLFIGENFSCVGCNYFCHDEPNTIVKIGNDCMFSFGITMWPSDGHTILDSNGNCINKGEDIFIGNHVWVGMNSTLLKGSFIPENSVVGACSVFTKNSNLDENFKTGGEGVASPLRKNSDGGIIFAGIPAKKIKSNINWDRFNCYDYELRLKNGEK